MKSEQRKIRQENKKKRILTIERRLVLQAPPESLTLEVLHMETKGRKSSYPCKNRGADQVRRKRGKTEWKKDKNARQQLEKI